MELYYIEFIVKMEIKDLRTRVFQTIRTTTITTTTGQKRKIYGCIIRINSFYAVRLFLCALSLSLSLPKCFVFVSHFHLLSHHMIANKFSFHIFFLFYRKDFNFLLLCVRSFIHRLIRRFFTFCVCAEKFYFRFH